MSKRIEQIGLDRLQVSELIDKWIFNKRDREILKRRLLDGVRFDDLSAEFGISVRHTKKIVYTGEDRVISKASPWTL